MGACNQTKKKNTGLGGDIVKKGQPKKGIDRDKLQKIEEEKLGLIKEQTSGGENTGPTNDGVDKSDQTNGQPKQQFVKDKTLLDQTDEKTNLKIQKFHSQDLIFANQV